MQTFNSFETLLNTQPLTGNFSTFAGISDHPPLVENAYSEQEKQQRIAMCEKQMQIAQREMQQITHLFGVMSDPRKRKMHRLDMPEPLSPAQQAEKQDRRNGLKIRCDALRKRIEQIESTDPTGQYVVQCQAIEDKLEKFQSQLGQIVDKPNAAQAQQHGTSNVSLHQLFQD